MTFNPRTGKPYQFDQRWLLYQFKALADENRLTMLGLMAEREYNVGELAARLGLTEPTVSHHLAKLREAALIMLRTDGNQRFYRVNPTTLLELKEAVQNVEKLPVVVTEPKDDSWIDALPEDFSDEDRALLREMTSNGKLKQIPSKQIKLLVLLRWLATKFDAERIYAEKEVNEIIKTVYANDYATLRRDLVDFGFLRRERAGSKYWLTPENEDEITQGFTNPSAT